MQVELQNGERYDLLFKANKQRGGKYMIMMERCVERKHARHR
jgi:hypothetical protein